MSDRVIYKTISFTAAGTSTIALPGAARIVSFTAVGVGGTPTAWDLDIDGYMSNEAVETGVELDGHNNGVEALGAVVNVAVTAKVITKIVADLVSVTLNGATALKVELAILLY